MGQSIDLVYDLILLCLEHFLVVSEITGFLSKSLKEISEGEL